MSIEARVKYQLSERGRRDSLRRGGTGVRQQVMTGPIEPELLDSFQVDEQGDVHFDATLAPAEVSTEKWRVITTHHGPSKGVQAYTSYAVEWDVAPSWADLLDFVRWAHRGFEDEEKQISAEAQIENERYGQVVQTFLVDPFARADKVSEDYVEIAGVTYWEADVVRVAKERAARDLEARRQANRATLRRWIQEHGSENQRQRLAADLLPWEEAHSELEKHLFAPLEQFPLYSRFDVKEVCACSLAGESPCGLKFQSVDATNLNAEQWDQLSAIRAAVSDAQFQIREHRAKCKSRTETQVKRGVIVKRTVDQLTFKREYALGGVHDVEGF